MLYTIVTTNSYIMFTTKNFFTLVGKHLIVVFSTIIVAVIIVFFLSKEITSISASVAKNRELATVLSERTSLFSNLKKENEIVGSNDTVIKQAFIPSNNILSFVAILKSIALKNGVTQVYSFSTPAPSSTGSSFPVTTIAYQNTVSSNVIIFMNYLKDFEKLPYFTKINSLTITSSQGDWLSGASASFGGTVATEAVQ